MRARRLIVPLALLAAALLARRRRRRHAPAPPLAPSPPVEPLAASAATRGLPAGPPAERFVSVPWELVEAPAGESQLTIRYRDDEHMALDRVDAQETPTQVFVTVLMRRDPPAGGRFAHEQPHEAVVPLSGPLGERELVHAPVDVEGLAPAPGDDEPSDPPV